MAIRSVRARWMHRLLCPLLAFAVAAAPSVWAMAQSNAAAMAVRQRVQGLEGGPGAPAQESPPQREAPAPGATLPGQPAPGMIDTRFISPNAAIVVVLRPAQIMAAPIAQMFPVEVATAAGLQYLGFDPAQIDEIVAFAEMSNPTAPAYGVTFKFKNPIRATSIPAERRAHAQLAELNGKKYLKSSVPMLYSLYGPNNHTLVIAPDATLQQLVSAASTPKSGPLMDRLRDTPAGSDLFLAVDLAPLRPLIPMLLMQAQAKIPPEAKQYLEIPNLISAVELTLNLSAPGPTSLVIQGNDEAAAQKLEALMQEALQKFRTAAADPQAAADPIAQAMTRYNERVAQSFQPQRNGTSITCFHTDGQNPAQQQVVVIAVIGIAVAAILPAIQAARNAARRAEAARSAQPVNGSPATPGTPRDSTPPGGSPPP